MPTSKKYISYEITKLGKYLRQLRKEQGLSIRSVAKSCSIAPSYLAKIEIGDTFKTIGIATLVKFSKFYGIPVSSMLKEAGFINSYDDDLPELAQYLRAKYQLSPQAIRDMEMAKEIVDKKYKYTERDDTKRSR
ncbi:MAG: helix-turn-helix domain-containing protein [Candidatus Azambacteria bacterium]|nr:helix-turn-helix domain-containing protein [Candidatus Azambacteria bacterium]